MKWARTVWLSALIMAVFHFSFCTPSYGQASQKKMPLKIRKITGTKQKTPQYKLLTGQKMARTRNWYVINVQYETAPDWTDEIVFDYYVLLKGKNPKQPKHTLLTGHVSYINVEKGKHLSDMYLHPSTIARYGEVQGVACVVKVQGRTVAIGTQPSSKQRWWEQLTPQPGLLLDRYQTPFAMINFDDYEAIKSRLSGR